MSVGILLGRYCELSYSYNSVRIEIGGRWLLANLVVMPTEWFDVILDMDWLSRYQAVIDCPRRWVSLYTKNSQIIYQNSQHSIWSSLILWSFLGGKRWLKTYGSLFAIDSDMGTGVGYSGLMVVDEFLDVFPDDLSGLSPDKEIEFSIDLVLGA